MQAAKAHCASAGSRKSLQTKKTPEKAQSPLPNYVTVTNATSEEAKFVPVLAMKSIP